MQLNCVIRSNRLDMIIHGPGNCSEKISLTSKPGNFYIPFYLLLFCIEENEYYSLEERTIKTVV